MTLPVYLQIDPSRLGGSCGGDSYADKLDRKKSFMMYMCIKHGTGNLKYV